MTIEPTPLQKVENEAYAELGRGKDLKALQRELEQLKQRVIALEMAKSETGKRKEK